MSWTLLLALAGASYALKAVGPVLAGGRDVDEIAGHRDVVGRLRLDVGE